MASSNVGNLPDANDPDKKTVVGGWATEEERRTIDIACAMLGKKRAHFVVESAFERALQIVRKANPASA